MQLTLHCPGAHIFEIEQTHGFISCISGIDVAIAKAVVKQSKHGQPWENKGTKHGCTTESEI